MVWELGGSENRFANGLQAGSEHRRGFGADGGAQCLLSATGSPPVRGQPSPPFLKASKSPLVDLVNASQARPGACRVSLLL